MAATVVGPAAASPQLALPLPPSIDRLIVNIGSNTDPLLPSDASTAALAFEPIVPYRIKPSPNLYVVPAAVSAR